VIATAILNSIAFPWVLVNKANEVLQYGSGALFSQPNASLSAVEGVLAGWDDGGWTRTADGYAAYKFSTKAIAPNSIILYGLKINGVSTAHGRVSGLSVRLDREPLVAYAAHFCSGVEALDDSYRRLIRENIHEIRGINSALYNTAYELESLLEKARPTPDRPDKVATSVVRLSELLRGRIDFMEFIANPDTVTSGNVEIAVYKKFDKVQRCFRVTANKKEIRLHMQGQSNSVVYGPPIFDIVPYLLLDNAVKYSPPGRPIAIVCNESEKRIYCKVTSVGPTIEPNEIQGIFSSSVRGANAAKTGAGGSGLGLAVLARVVKNAFGGQIEVSQAGPIENISGVPHNEVSFEVTLPKHR
jgi:signal transduction histidine kinase